MQNQVNSKARVIFEVLFCEETVYVPMDFFVKILKSQKKTYNLFWEKYSSVLRNTEVFFEVLNLILPKDRSFTCFEDGCPQLTHLTSHKHTAVFKRCRPRTSETAICAFRNVSCQEARTSQGREHTHTSGAGKRK